MTENIPPVPPQPQPQGYPSYPVPGVDQNQAPYAPAQPYPPSQAYPAAPPAYGQQPYQQQHQGPYQQPPVAQFAAYPPHPYAPGGYPGQPKPKSSGQRVAAGIIGIVLGTWTVLPSVVGISGASGPFVSALLLLSALATITAGIMVLVTQRARARWAAVTLLSTAGATVLLGFMGAWTGDYGRGVFMTILPLAVPVGILLGLALAKEKRPAS